MRVFRLDEVFSAWIEAALVAAFLQFMANADVDTKRIIQKILLDKVTSGILSFWGEASHSCTPS